MIHSKSKKVVNKEKQGHQEKHVKVQSGEEGSTSDVNNPKKSASADGARATKSRKLTAKENSEMERIEELCKEFGVPDPGELYIIPRDFEITGNPNLTQFDMTMPEGLARWVDEDEYEYTVGQINSFFSSAEEVDCRTVWNGVCKFLTCFMIRACQRTRAERAIIRVRNFILHQNQDVYHPKGFHIVEPAARGLRHLEFRSITYYSMKYFLDHEDEVELSESDGHLLHHQHYDDAPPIAHLHARGSAMSHF